MTSFKLSFPQGRNIVQKIFISGTDTYGSSIVKKLESHSNDKAFIQEGIVKRRHFIPSLDLDLVSVRDTANGAGGQYASNKREDNHLG